MGFLYPVDNPSQESKACVFLYYLFLDLFEKINLFYACIKNQIRPSTDSVCLVKHGLGKYTSKYKRAA